MGDEYIKKEDAIQSIIAHDIVGVDARGWAEYLLENAPTIDAVPVVPCKDCKWSNVYQVDSNFPMERWCDGGFIPKSVQDYDYCSWGERKDDE